MYREIVETSPDGIWVVDLEGRTLYANAAMARLLGHTPAAMAGLSMYDAHDEDGCRQLSEHFAELRAGRANPTDVECLFVRKDGSGVWVLVSESLLPAEGEDPARVVLRVTDWTERRLLVDRLSRHQAALAEAEGIARIGSWRYHPDSDLLVPSAGLCAALGVDATTAPRTREAFLALVHPDDRDRLDRASASALERGESFEAEVRIRTPAGYRWFAGRGRVGDDGDGALVHTGTFQDVHDARETQEALQDAVLQNTLMQATAAAANQAESVDDVLRMARDLVMAHDDWDRGRAYVPDATGRVEPYYVDDTDRAEDDELPALVAAERRLAQEAYDTRGVAWGDQPPDRYSVAFPVIHDGVVVLVVVIGEAEPFVRPEMIAAMVTQAAVQIAHVVERERAAQELAAARDAAMEGSRQKSEFLATMSHEIRTPLNGIIGLNELMLRTSLDPEQQRLATGVQVSSRALLALINDVLDFSKIEAGRLELEEIEFEVRAVFDQVASVLGEGARSRGLDLVVACHADVPEVLVGDPTRLSQVLTNLGSNAIKFTDVGTVRIEASRSVPDGSEPADPDEVVIRVDVTDTGVGIPAEQQEEVFRRFVQADTSTTRRYGGTGLGLAICREIVEALGGELGVESRVGDGSRFWFTARLRAAGDDRVDAEDRRVREAIAGRRVLVVDDVEHNRLILSEQVGWWGVRGTAVSSVAEALDALEEARRGQDPFELVLLDFAMPEQDGFDLAAAVRSRPELAGLPLVMLSSTLPPRADRLAAAGIAACASKPVLSSTLRTLLLTHLCPDLAPEAPAPVEVAARPRVLVVEDNPVNQMVAAGLLDALGYDADTVDDGLAGVHAVRRAREAVAAGAAGPDGGAGSGYALVLMDLQMPRLDGYDATRAIRAAEAAHGWPRLPIVAMTASAVHGERERCLEAGMDDFLTKPVDARVLGDLAGHWVALGERPDAAPPDPGGTPADEGVELDRHRLDELRDLTPDHAYLDRVIERFRSHSQSLLDDVAAAAERGDADALRAAAHSLKGSVTNLGLVRVGELALELERRGARGELAEVPALLPVLVAAVERGRRQLLDYRAEYAAG